MTPAELRDALGYIDANSAAIQVTGAMALLLGFIQYGEAIRLGFRDRTHAIPLVAVLFHLANDVNYSIHYFRWFHEVRHGFFTTQWFLILPFTVLELVVSWQLMTYSRAEVFPNFTRRQAWMAFIALGIAMFTAHRYIASVTDDYLGEKTNMLTLIFSNLGFYLLIRRGNRKGQSMLLACTLILCAGAPQFFVHFPSMGPAFRTPEFYTLGTVTTLAGIAYVIMLARAPRYSHDTVEQLRTIRVE